ncbi:MAG TPA: holo-ACP synthase [Dictyobacter sp.]|jgi:holo-[acyl-carrier protein] synthase|nr:holo-ACP synthase [Dictyobacter sp.]
MYASPYRVGIDIVYVPHVLDSIERFGSRFLDRIFTKEEQVYCRQHASISIVAQSFAARFAAKEATIKVLRPAASFSLDWRCIAVHRSPEGWCDILLSEQAADLARSRGIVSLSLSMSHECEYATAVVVADF